MRRSINDGSTWIDAGGPNAGVLVEVPQASGLPGDLRAGHLLAGHRGGTNGTSLSRSTDRGATWSLVPGLPGGSAVADLLVLPVWHENAGRLIAPTFIYGAYLGATDADTGALVMERTPESEANIRRALEHLALFPSGRVLATGYVGGQPDNRAFVSDDGGETWRETARLPEPREGIPGDAWILMLGGPSALAVGGRGVMYRTDDEGETWAIVGRTPVTDSGMTSQEMVLGPEGHLYLALKRVGTDRGWVMQTAGAVVSSALVLPEASGASLRVTPNPASGAVQIRLASGSPEAARVTVFDARGREVWTSGARGSRSFEVNTSAWAAGVYVVRAEIGGEVVTIRFTVAR